MAFGGVRHINFYKDDYSGRYWLHYLKSLKGSLNSLKVFVHESKLGIREQLLNLRIDNPGGYTSIEFVNFCLEKGIRLERITPGVHSQHGDIEAGQGQVLKLTRIAHNQSGLPKTWWIVTTMHAAFVANATPRDRNGGKSAFDLWFNCNFDTSFLKVFGCKALVYERPAKLNKIELRSKEGIYVGSTSDTAGFLILMLDGFIHLKYHVRFLENKFPAKEEKEKWSNILKFGPRWTRTTAAILRRGGFDPLREKMIEEAQDLHSQVDPTTTPEDEQLSVRAEMLKSVNTPGPQYNPDIKYPDTMSEECEEKSPNLSASEKLSSELILPEKTGDPSPSEQISPSGDGGEHDEGSLTLPDLEKSSVDSSQIQPTHQGRRERKPRLPFNVGGSQQELFAESYIAMVEHNQSHSDPGTIRDCENSPDKEKWRKARLAEIANMKSLNVWEEIEKKEMIMPSPKPITLKWVFKRKRDGSGKVVRFKARLVARGFTQTDFSATFSPVIRLSTLRLMLAYFGSKGWVIEQIDITAAFLHADLPKPVFAYPPPGMNLPNKLLRLHKAIYGLKDACRLWYETLAEFLVRMGFTKCPFDPCLFSMQTEEGKVFVTVFVDDILIIGKSSHRVEIVKSVILKKFPGTNLGKISHLLKMNVIYEQESKVVVIHLAQYIDQLLLQCGMSNCKPVSTPMDPGFDSNNDTLSSGGDIDEPYKSLLGGLMYLSLAARPDITFAVSKLARYASKPKLAHWKALKRILRYLAGTKDLKLRLGAVGDEPKVLTFVDSDYAADTEDRKSTTGYGITLGLGLIVWRTVKQSAVALSTCEAEYMALGSAVADGLFLNRVYNWIARDEKKSGNIIMRVFCDNQGAIYTGSGPMINRRVKHVEVKYHFVKDYIRRGDVEVMHISGVENLADSFTKPLPGPAFLRYRNEVLGHEPASHKTEKKLK